MPNILLVDDEPDVLRALGLALRLGGHHVETAGSAKLALEAATESSFDIVVLDYIMPSMTGIDLLHRIRKIQPNIRSVIVSGKLDLARPEETIAQELKSKIDADLYLHKPVDNAKLLSSLESLMNASTDMDWKSIAERKLALVKSGPVVRDAVKQLNKMKRRRKKK